MDCGLQLEDPEDHKRETGAQALREALGLEELPPFDPPSGLKRLSGRGDVSRVERQPEGRCRRNTALVHRCKNGGLILNGLPQLKT